MAFEGNPSKLHKMIDGIQYAMLTTRDSEGHLRSRPMSTIEVVSDRELWFFTHSNSEKSHEVEKDAQVNVSYSSPDDQKYVSVSGRAEIVRDREVFPKYWKPEYKTWFPKGLDEPNLALIRVEIEQAEYWDASSSQMIRALSHLGAIATGTASESAEHKKLAV